jgi:transposase InsO family protein
VNNILDLWQSDVLDLQSFAKHNNNYRYVLSVIDVFSKYLHLVPLKRKTGSVVAKALGSILRDSPYMKPWVRRPLVVQTDKGKEYVNKAFQDLLQREGIEHRICRNPDVRCAVVERVHRTIREKIYRYFTHRNTYRYINVLKNLYQLITPFMQERAWLLPK